MRDGQGKLAVGVKYEFRVTRTCSSFPIKNHTRTVRLGLTGYAHNVRQLSCAAQLRSVCMQLGTVKRRKFYLIHTRRLPHATVMHCSMPRDLAMDIWGNGHGWLSSQRRRWVPVPALLGEDDLCCPCSNGWMYNSDESWGARS